jgi:hypothetical protein
LKAAVLECHPSRFRSGVLLEQIRQLTQEIERFNTASVPPYLRMDHAHFAPELAAAVAAWLALYHQKQFRPALGHDKQLLAWLCSREDRTDHAPCRAKVAASPWQAGHSGRDFFLQPVPKPGSRDARMLPAAWRTRHTVPRSERISGFRATGVEARKVDRVRP